MRAQRQKARGDRGGDGARDQRALGRENMRVALAATRDLRFDPKRREIVQTRRREAWREGRREKHQPNAGDPKKRRPAAQAPVAQAEPEKIDDERQNHRGSDLGLQLDRVLKLEPTRIFGRSRQGVLAFIDPLPHPLGIDPQRLEFRGGARPREEQRREGSNEHGEAARRQGDGDAARFRGAQFVRA